MSSYTVEIRDTHFKGLSAFYSRMLIYCLAPSDVSVCLVVREVRGGGTEYWRDCLICQSAHFTQILTSIPPRPLGSSKVLNNSICNASEPTVQASESVSICSNWNVVSLLSPVPCWMGLEKVEGVFSSLVQYIRHIYCIELVFQIQVYLLVGVTVPTFRWESFHLIFWEKNRLTDRENEFSLYRTIYQCTTLQKSAW